MRRLLALLVAVAAGLLGPYPSAPAFSAPASESTIGHPSTWPGGGLPGYPTALHIGTDADWSMQLRPIGDVRAIMLFVDFPNATAAGNTAPYQRTQTYYDNLVPGAVDFFRTASYGRFRLTVDAPARFYRMSRNDADYGFGYFTPPYTAWVAEVRQRAGVDAAACDRGVLVYRVDTTRPDGAGTLRVQDAHPATSVCGLALNDAPYDLGPGEVSTFHDAASGTRIELLGTSGGDYTVRVTSGTGVPGTTVSVRVTVEAADNDAGSMVEAGIDDVRIVRT